MKKRKILLVDDEKLNIEILKKYLFGEGFELHEANSAFEAMQVLEEKEVDLILLDRNMPFVSGMDFLKEIKKVEKLKNIPVIFQTALSQLPDAVEGYKEGCSHYLTKPYSKDVLLKVVKKALGI